MVEAHVTTPARLAHIVLNVRHFDEARRWYATVLGANEFYATDRICFLTYDDKEHRLVLVNTPDLELPRRPHAGLEHFAFAYESMGDLLDTYLRLKALDIPPVRCVNHGPTTSMYYNDPDGNRIELQIDNFDSIEDAQRWLADNAFDDTGTGAEFDPDELLEKFNAGVPESELKQVQA